jgi:hypothetical protein
MEASDHPHAPTTLSLGKKHEYPLNMGLGGQQDQSRRFGEEIHRTASPEFEQWVVQLVA